MWDESAVVKKELDSSFWFEVLIKFLRNDFCKIVKRLTILQNTIISAERAKFWESRLLVSSGRLFVV
ncbi:MAG TPA: hypothetical protein VGC76_02790 [Pyrinomonadaceae bacterium]|jgi:hypothetical protein